MVHVVSKLCLERQTHKQNSVVEGVPTFCYFHYFYFSTLAHLWTGAPTFRWLETRKIKLSIKTMENYPMNTITLLFSEYSIDQSNFPDGLYKFLPKLLGFAY